MSWLNKQVSLYETHADNVGRSSTLRSVLLSDFGKDMQAICDLRNLDRSSEQFKTEKLRLKESLQGFTPGALLTTRKTKAESEIVRTGVMQIDFDYEGIKEYDIDELKQAVFNLPYVGFCGLSCSGDGFFALVMISEPEKIRDYAEHCFDFFKGYGVTPDTSKGRNVNDLRYVSYDKNMLIRDNPDPLFVREFKKKHEPKASTNSTPVIRNNSALTVLKLTELSGAQVGQRWATVQNVAYTLGGLGDKNLLENIKQAINNNQSFHNEEDKYFKCAEDCFNAGYNKPLTKNSQNG